jgi:tetratricopeptide (TPR) repeat protein
MSDPLRTDSARVNDTASASGRDAKIEQLLLLGLDQYFAAHYDLAINVWTRVLFLDRSHARARAYIERARSALAERMRESEELLQNGVAAFRRGEGDEARRLLQAAIDSGAPSDEALAVLDRMNRLETAPLPAVAARSDRRHHDEVPRAAGRSSRPIGGLIAFLMTGAAIVALAVFAASRDQIDWRQLLDLARSAGRVAAPAAAVAAPVARESTLPLPRRGETMLSHARTLAAGGHLHDALVTLESVRPTDPQKADADRLRGDIQRQLLALTTLPAAPPREEEKAVRRVP